MLRGSAVVAFFAMSLTLLTTRNGIGQTIVTDPDPVQFGCACQYSVANPPLNVQTYL